ncbi:MAG: PaaI family thioesterase [Halodesulfurarchaeum sp.]
MAAGHEETVAALQAFLDDHPFLSALSVELVAVEPGAVTMQIPYDRDYTNPADDGARPMHGGVIATLVDTASAFALRAQSDRPGELSLATIDMTVSYLRPATGTIEADASVIRAGDSVGVTEVDVRGAVGEEKGDADGDGDRDENPTMESNPLVASGMTNYRIFGGMD